MNPRLAIQVYELNPLDEQISRVDPCSDGNVNTWLVPRRESEQLRSRAQEALAPIVTLAPEAITVHAVALQEVVLRFLGLPFAHWKDGRVYFGIGAAVEEWTGATENKLKRLLTQLRDFRNPLASETRHPFYRAQAERWMQTLVAQGVSRVDIKLHPEHLYEQVFARTAAQHAVLDLLGVTRTKRLAILELKAAENPDRGRRRITGCASSAIKRREIWRDTGILREWSCNRRRRWCIW